MQKKINEPYNSIRHRAVSSLLPSTQVFPCCRSLQVQATEELQPKPLKPPAHLHSCLRPYPTYLTEASSLSPSSAPTHVRRRSEDQDPAEGGEAACYPQPQQQTSTSQRPPTIQPPMPARTSDAAAACSF